MVASFANPPSTLRSRQRNKKPDAKLVPAVGGYYKTENRRGVLNNVLSLYVEIRFYGVHLDIFSLDDETFSYT